MNKYETLNKEFRNLANKYGVPISDLTLVNHILVNLEYDYRVEVTDDIFDYTIQSVANWNWSWDYETAYDKVMTEVLEYVGIED